MAERLNSISQTVESAVWTPADDCWLQIDTVSDTAAVDVQVRLMDAGPWTTIETLHRTVKPITRIAYGTALKLVLRNNTTGVSVKVRDQT